MTLFFVGWFSAMASTAILTGDQAGAGFYFCLATLQLCGYRIELRGGKPPSRILALGWISSFIGVFIALLFMVNK